MFAIIPGAEALLSAFDWQTALQVFALACSLMVAFSVFMKTAEGHQAHSNNEDNAPTSVKDALKEAFSHKGYWLIHAGFFVCGFHVMFIATHLPSYLGDKGLAASSAAMALAYVGIFNI
ncbi:MFS transporter, partial [Sinorhizobium meliloti]